MKPKPFMALYLDRAGLLDGGSVGRRINRSLWSSASGWLLLRGAAIDTQDFGDLWPLGPRTGANLERRTRRYATVAAALDHTHMQEGIAGPIGKFYKAESLVGIVPFDDGLDRGTGGCFEPLGAKPQCRSETAPGWFEVVVVESTATGQAKISVSAAHLRLCGYSCPQFEITRGLIVNKFRTRAVPAVGCAYKSVSVPDTSVWIGLPTLKGLRPSHGERIAALPARRPGFSLLRPVSPTGRDAAQRRAGGLKAATPD